jgi:hypothetical protein
MPIDHDRSLIDIGGLLPPVDEVKLRPWGESFGGDYYGALRIAAEYCGFKNIPPRFPGGWQHGLMPPWQQIRPEIVVYDAPRPVRCFVARQDEAQFLKTGGYSRVQAIGLPIIYTQPSGLPRIPNSVLVMPTHSLASDVVAPSTEQYVREIAGIRGKFDVMAVCVSAYCIAKGLWAPQFAAHGIQVVRGAGISDANALKRMRALFDTFEYVTTDSFGSHVFYALYFGAKVSIWGTATPVYRENVLSDGGWTRYPEAVDKLLSEETVRRGEQYLGPLRVEPWNGVLDVGTGEFMLGHENKLNPEELRATLGWTRPGILASRMSELVRSSPVWRAARATKRRLTQVAGSRSPAP